MKCRFLLFLLFFLLFLPRIQADILDDYEVELAKIAQTGNYKNAVNAPGSSFAKEYESSLQLLTTLGRKLDKCLIETMPGSNFSFHSLSREITALYKFNAEKMRHPENYRKKQNKKKQNRSKNDLKNILQDPAPLFKLLLADIKSLRKIGFTEESGPRISGKNYLTKDLLSYRHALATFTAFRQQYFRKKTPQALRKELDKRFTFLAFAGRKLQDTLQKYSDGSAALEHNIARETTNMLQNFEKYRELVLEGRRGSGKKTTTIYDREIRTSLQKIESSLHSLARSGLEGSTAAPRLSPRKTRSTYLSLSRDALEKELLKRRLQIYRGNILMDGVDKDTLRKYLLTLTKPEKALYEKLRKERIDTGYAVESATKTALLAVQSQERIEADKKLLISLLEKLDREEEKAREKK